MNRSRFLLPAAGLALGFLVVLVLPGSLLFVDHTPAATHEGGGDVRYACPMFCVILDEKPDDGRCPVCGMELTEVSGKSILNQAEQRMVGLRTAVVERRPLVRTVRAVGEADYDETRVSRVTARAAGWLEEVFAETTYATVAEGEPLFSLYAPELYEAQQDLLVAGDDPVLLAAAKRRLALLGVGDAEVAEIAASGEVRRALVLRSPRDGVVVERRAVTDRSVMKGETLYTIADLDRLWIQSEVYEKDLPLVREGMAARIDAEGFAGPRDAQVVFVDPVVDPRTRTARVRIEIDNRADEDGRRPLRVGQRVDATIEARIGADGRVVPPGTEPGKDPLVLPRTAILATGERAVAYVLYVEKATVDGKVRDYDIDPDRLPPAVYYEMVQVRVGPLARAPGAGPGEEFFPVLGTVPGGPRLAAGTVVVTSGNLLLDSQAQLSGKPSLLFPEGNRGKSADPHAGH